MSCGCTPSIVKETTAALLGGGADQAAAAAVPPGARSRARAGACSCAATRSRPSDSTYSSAAPRPIAPEMLGVPASNLPGQLVVGACASMAHRAGSCRRRPARAASPRAAIRARRARRCRSARRPCGRRRRRNRNPAPARRPRRGRSPGRRRAAPARRAHAPAARSRCTGSTVPSALETCATATRRVRCAEQRAGTRPDRARRSAVSGAARSRAPVAAQTHLPGHDVGVVFEVA